MRDSGIELSIRLLVNGLLSLQESSGRVEGGFYSSPRRRELSITGTCEAALWLLIFGRRLLGSEAIDRALRAASFCARICEYNGMCPKTCGIDGRGAPDLTSTSLVAYVLSRVSDLLGGISAPKLSAHSVKLDVPNMPLEAKLYLLLAESPGGDVRELLTRSVLEELEHICKNGFCRRRRVLPGRCRGYDIIRPLNVVLGSPLKLLRRELGSVAADCYARLLSRIAGMLASIGYIPEWISGSRHSCYMDTAATGVAVSVLAENRIHVYEKPLGFLALLVEEDGLIRSSYPINCSFGALRLLNPRSKSLSATIGVLSGLLSAKLFG